MLVSRLTISHGTSKVAQTLNNGYLFFLFFRRFLSLSTEAIAPSLWKVLLLPSTIPFPVPQLPVPPPVPYISIHTPLAEDVPGPVPNHPLHTLLILPIRIRKLKVSRVGIC